MDISEYEIEALPFVDRGTSEKVLKESGEKVLCEMEFHRFKVVIPLKAEEIETHLSDDLVEVQWFSPEEVVHIEQVP